MTVSQPHCVIFRHKDGEVFIVSAGLKNINFNLKLEKISLGFDNQEKTKNSLYQQQQQQQCKLTQW